MMAIQLRCILLHDLLSMLESSLVLRLGRFSILNLFSRAIRKEVLDGPCSCRRLVYSKGRCKLSMGSYIDGIE